MTPQVQWTPGGFIGALLGFGLTWLLIEVGVMTSPFDFGDTWGQAWIVGGVIITGFSFVGWAVEMAIAGKGDT
jgi:hypothetical protein